MSKSVEAFRTIAEVADDLAVPKHVLRFWEVKFPQIRPMKRGGGRRYYRPEDLELLRGIQALLHAEAYTIKGVQKILREQGVDHVKQFGREPLTIPGSAAAGKRKRGAADGAAVSAPTAVSSAAVHRAPGPTAGAGGASGSTRTPVSRAAAAGTRQRIQALIVELAACRALLGGDRPQAGDSAVATTGSTAGRVRAGR
ncbi:MAG: MerR family transcriptional regulator [Hyphomicrobium sp.]